MVSSKFWVLRSESAVLSKVSLDGRNNKYTVHIHSDYLQKKIFFPLIYMLRLNHASVSKKLGGLIA